MCNKTLTAATVGYAEAALHGTVSRDAELRCGRVAAPKVRAVVETSAARPMLAAAACFMVLRAVVETSAAALRRGGHSGTARGPTSLAAPHMRARGAEAERACDGGRGGGSRNTRALRQDGIRVWRVGDTELLTAAIRNY